LNNWGMSQVTASLITVPDHTMVLLPMVRFIRIVTLGYNYTVFPYFHIGTYIASSTYFSTSSNGCASINNRWRMNVCVKNGSGVEQKC
jgi:hypothetical protein